MIDYQTFQVHWFCLQVQASSVTFIYLATLNLALVFAYFQGVLQIFLWFRTIQSGRVLRRSVVQSPTQSSVSYQVRPGHLRLCPPGSWKPPRMEAAQALWATCSCLTGFLGQRVWNSTQSESPFFSLCRLSLILQLWGTTCLLKSYWFDLKHLYSPFGFL